MKKRPDLILVRPQNDNECDWPANVTLDSETRKRFVRALAEMVVEGIRRKRQQQQNEQTK